MIQRAREEPARFTELTEVALQNFHSASDILQKCHLAIIEIAEPFALEHVPLVRISKARDVLIGNLKALANLIAVVKVTKVDRELLPHVPSTAAEVETNLMEWTTSSISKGA